MNWWLKHVLKCVLCEEAVGDESGGGAGDAAGTGGAEGTGAELTGGEGGAAGEGGETGGEAGGEGSAAPAAGASGDDVEARRKETVSKRFSTVTKERDDALKEAQRSREQLDAALEALKRSGGKLESDTSGADKPTGRTTTTQDEELVPPVFDGDIEAYQEAMVEYTGRLVDQRLKNDRERARADAAREAQETTAQQEVQRRGQVWIDRRKAAIEKHDDYEAIADNPDVHITPIMAHGITGHEHGPDIAYYLGLHPEVAEKIAKMTPELQLMELGRIGYEVSQPPKPVATSKVDPPLDTLKPGSGAASRELDELSMEEYAAKRNGKR